MRHPLVRWTAAGLLAALPLALLDIWRALPSDHPTAIWGLLLALHLAAGAVVGPLLGLLSWALGGLTLDKLPQHLRALLVPLRKHRALRSAQILLTPAALALTIGLLFVLNRRFFRFNNPTLASALLAILAVVLIGLAVAVWRRLTAALAGLIQRLATHNLPVLDDPRVWLPLPIGLLLGAIFGIALRANTALQETWEALDLAPLAGLAILGLLTAAAEILTRRGRPRLALIVAGGLALALLPAWSGALKPDAITGPDNLLIHQRAPLSGLYLKVAERVTDADRDGFSARFGQGDCNDADPNAYPGSADGDDCLGAAPLMDKAALMAKLRGPTPSPKSAQEPAQGASSAPAADPQSPLSQPPVAVAPSPEPPVALPPDPALPHAPKPTLRRPYNIVLITIDTVRADHTGFMGYARETTPNLDRLAARSAVFNRAYSPSNMTPASIPAIIAGRYTTELWRDDKHFIHFGPKNTFLAETLQAEGYDTHAVMTHWYFEPRKRSGLNQGFAHWKVVGTRWGKQMEDASTSALVTDAGLAELAAMPTDRPWFLWLHYLDPHKWYIFHPGFDKRWGRRSKDRYDHEIAFADHHVGRFLKALRAHPQADHTALIVTSDHGEAFGEHKTSFHGFSLYEDQVRVPLIIHVPGLAPTQVDQRRGLIDLVPTALDLAAIRAPRGLQGQSLLPDLQGHPSPQRLIYAERPRGPYSAGMRMLVDGDLKIIWRASGNRYELYDIAQDPAELTDLWKTRPQDAARMKQQLTSLVRLALDQKGKLTRTK